MPAAVRTPEDEADWTRAKEIVSKQYPDKAEAAASGGDKSGFYALVMTVFKDIQKGRDKTESVAPEEIQNALIILRRADGSRAHADALEVQIESAKLKPGDSVVVVTKTGRTMGEGAVVDASASQVTVRTGGADGMDIVRTYATDIYAFMKKVERKVEPTLGEDATAPDGSPLPEADFEDAGAFPITHAGTYDMASPGVEVVRQYISDRRLAYAFYVDMTSRGAAWAARRHSIDADTVDRIVIALRSRDMIPDVSSTVTDLGFSAVPPGDGAYPSAFEESVNDVPPLHRWDQEVTARGEVTMTWKDFTVVQKTSKVPGLPTYTISKGGKQIDKPVQDGRVAMKTIAANLDEAANPRAAEFSASMRKALAAVDKDDWSAVDTIIKPLATAKLFQRVMAKLVAFVQDRWRAQARTAIRDLIAWADASPALAESVYFDLFAAVVTEDKVIDAWINEPEFGVMKQARRAWAAIETRDPKVNILNAIRFGTEVIGDVNAHTAARALDAAFPGDDAYPDSMTLSAGEISMKLDYGIEPAFAFAVALVKLAGGKSEANKMARVLRAAEPRMFESAADALGRVAEMALAEAQSGRIEAASRMLRPARVRWESAPAIYAAITASLVLAEDADRGAMVGALARLIENAKALRG
ncbi:hypothetical protein UFOVP1382_172 [uncultured Caudovirales phage]|uniref:Uncharacterized protein n=1 Tax=uncultured Caudovirales phage TaxID=2100421 RepID=A0A6J5S5B2_9CAUD|nr:hypothetical protein UFOVP1382_172 [uncultured Caudovirales phage]